MDMPKPKRVLICTPTRGDLSAGWVVNVIHVMLANWEGRFVFDCPPSLVGGCSVAEARNRLACDALGRNYDLILWWDADLYYENPAMAIAAVNRMLMLATPEHPIICAQYCTHSLLTHFHGMRQPESVPDKEGLLPMKLAAIGFSVMDCNVFSAIREAFPNGKYQATSVGHEPLADQYDFFPCGVTQIGPDHREYVGEDYGFCMLCEQAGIPIMLDTQIVVTHRHSTMLPIPSATIAAMVKEEWRNPKR